MKRAILAALAATALAAAALVAVVSGGPGSSAAADHVDAPGLTPPGGNLQLDLTDVYAWRARNGNTVLAMNVNGLTAAGKRPVFASGSPSVARTKAVTYWWRIDNDGDATADVNIGVSFGKANKAGRPRADRQAQRKDPGGRPDEPGQERDDEPQRRRPGVRWSPRRSVLLRPRRVHQHPVEGGRQVLPRLHQPADRLLRRQERVCDRPRAAGVAADGLGLVGDRRVVGDDGRLEADRPHGSASREHGVRAVQPVREGRAFGKNTFNASQPKNDTAKFRAEVVDTLQVLFSLNDGAGDNKADDAMKIAGLADVLLPDILTFDTAKSDGFLNGRKLADDVIDAELNLITEGAVKTDCVSKNDRAFRAAFPYLGTPH